MTETLEAQRVRPSTLLSFMTTLHGVNHFYQLLLPAVLPLVILDFQITYQQAGILVGSFTLSYALSQLIFGRYSETFGRRNLLAVGVVVLALATLAAAFARGFEDLLIIELAAGVGGSMYHPLGPPTIMDTYRAERRGFAMGVHSTGGALGSFLSPLVVGALALLLGWRGAFMGLSGVGVLVGMLYLFRTPPLRVESAKKPSFLKALRNRRLIYFVAATSLFGGSYFGLSFFTTSFASAVYGWEIVSAAALLGILQLGGIFSAPLFGALSDRLGKPVITLALAIVGCVSLYAVIVAPIPLLVVLFGILGVSVYGVFTVTDALMGEIVPPYLRTTAYGVYVAGLYLLTMVVSPLLGYLIDAYGFFVALNVLAILMASSIVPFIALFARKG